MSEFRYDRYSSPYVSDIAALIQRPAQAQAQAAQTIGAAQATAAQNIGAAWGSAGQNIGQAVSGAITQATDPKRQLEQQQVTGNQNSLKFEALANHIQSQLTVTNPDGSTTLDPAKYTQAMAAAGIPSTLQSAHLKAIDDVNASVKTFTKDRIDHAADLANSALEGIKNGADPLTAVATSVAVAKANRMIQDDQLGPLNDRIASGADLVPFLRAMRGLSENYKGVDKLQALPRESPGLFNPDSGAVSPVPQLPKPPTPSSIAMDAANPASPTQPQSAAANKLLKPDPVTSNEWKDVLLDGKPTKVFVNPKSQVVTTLDGAPVANAANRIKPIPPASITIHNDNARGVDLPTWATDGSRPSGPAGNVLDPAIRMTPNGLHQAALTNIATGQFPPTGRGTDPIAVAQRAAITSKVGAIAADAGMGEPALRAFYKSNAGSLTAQVKMQDAVQGFMATADKNAALLKPVLAKIPDLQSPLFNQPLRAFASKVAGDKDMAQLAVYLQSIQNEYGRIVSQPSLSGQLTDSARHEAETLVDKTQPVSAILASLQALENEGTNRVQSIGETIQRIQGRLQGGGTGGSTPPPPPAAAAPKPGGVTVTSPRGKVYPFATQADADRFVADAKAKGLWQ